MKVIFSGAVPSEDVTAHRAPDAGGKVILNFPKLGRMAWTHESYQAALNAGLCRELKTGGVGTC